MKRSSASFVALDCFAPLAMTMLDVGAERHEIKEFATLKQNAV
jgi:hypothetical protein